MKIVLMALSAFGYTLNAHASDPFDKFREVAPKKVAPAPKVHQKTQPKTSTVKKTSSAPVSNHRTTINLYCTGQVKRSTGSFEVQNVAFEFRTILDPAKGKHTVASVVSGPLFSSGATYDATALANDMVILGTEITSKQHWKLPSIKLDMTTSRLSGQGTVDLTEIRSRLSARLSSKYGGKSIPEGGLDAHRKVTVTGACQPVK